MKDLALENRSVVSVLESVRKRAFLIRVRIEHDEMEERRVCKLLIAFQDVGKGVEVE